MSGPLGSSQWMYTTEEYEIEKSVRLTNDDSSYLSRTPGSAGNQKTWTFSCWFKRGNLTDDQTIFQAGTTGGNRANIYLASNTIQFLDTTSTDVLFTSTLVLRDVAAWYHLVVQFDTTQGTASDRLKIYINGTRITSFTDSDTIAQNSDGLVNSTIAHAIGTPAYNSGIAQFDGYLSEVHFIDGTALTASSFGTTGAYGEWKPKKYGGSYGTNGFFFEFKQTGTSQNSSGIGADTSGNDNHWAVSGIASHDVMLDNPTNNFAVMASNDFGGATAFRDGGLFIRDSGTVLGLSTIRPTSGKWYWEVDLDGRYSGSPYWGALFSPANEDGDSHDYDEIGSSNVKIVSYSGGSNFITIEGGTLNATHGTWPADHIWGFAYDVDAGKLWISKNGDFTAVGVSGSNPSTATNPAATGLGKHCIPAFGPIGSTSAQFNAYLRANMGADGTFAGAQTSGGESDDNGYGDFKYDVPSGFLTLCTKNLPEPPVKPRKNFTTILYTGTGSSASHTLGFRPNLVWGKKRNAGQNHWLINDVGDVNKWLATDNSNDEGTEANGTTFDANGFTTASNDLFYNNGGNYVVWAWKGNGTGTAVTNESGSLDSTVSANTSAGISIINYQGNATSGATFGHGLSSAPELVIVKNRDSDGFGWVSGWSAIAFTNNLVLNTTDGVGTEAVQWNNTAPSSTLITLGSDNGTNKSGDDFICFAFHSVDGFSRFGKYNGNGSADGDFIYTGFKPKFVIIKSLASSTPWMMFDSERNLFNPVNTYLLTYTNSAEGDGGTSNMIDFCSNGFKQRGTHADMNQHGIDYVYMAFADIPLKYANAVAVF